MGFSQVAHLPSVRSQLSAGIRAQPIQKPTGSMAGLDLPGQDKKKYNEGRKEERGRERTRAGREERTLKKEGLRGVWRGEERALQRESQIQGMISL